jgi:hypothetical protein
MVLSCPPLWDRDQGTTKLQLNTHCAMSVKGMLV